MTMPGFTAEASLYSISEHFQSRATHVCPIYDPVTPAVSWGCTAHLTACVNNVGYVDCWASTGHRWLQAVASC